jgi:hypothetical protein
MYSIRLLLASKGTLEEGDASSVIGAVVEMSRVDIDLGSSAYAIGTKRVAAEDLGLGCREVGDLAIVGIVRGVPIKRHSSDLVLDSCGQLFDRVVQDGGALALRVSAGGDENEWTAKLTCIL